MIKINLSRLLGEKRINQKDFSKLAKVRRATINAYYNEYVKRINKEDLDKMCKSLNCQISDLIEYIPDEK